MTDQPQGLPELKPCPFCGGKANEDHYDGHYAEGCDSCSVWRPAGLWNTRAPVDTDAQADRQTGDVEAIEKAIVSWAFLECQPDKGDMFSWLDDNKRGLATYILGASAEVPVDVEKLKNGTYEIGVRNLTVSEIRAATGRLTGAQIDTDALDALKELAASPEPEPVEAGKVDMPDEIYVCGTGWKGKEDLSATACPNTYSHQTKYVRAALAQTPPADLPPVEKLVAARKAMNSSVGLSYCLFNSQAETIRALLDAAIKLTGERG